eukprot:TRINITY_DN1939_c0_g1_i2.p2 TRINITY_DN1939_c0_g1~~TRINITY_DN1939_c0_g1_i2.p2  ORF type:complete len:349 (+),score=108.71 TRINITY_DN1939_c0_g1_i2:2055-3101(+)
MSSESLIAEANDLFVDEDYESALEKFNEAIALNGNEGNYYTKRSACLYKLARYSEALEDANKAVQLTPADSASFMRQGMAAFALDNFQTALAAFTKGNELKTSAQFKTWIRKCEAELGDGKAAQPATPAPVAKPAPVSTTTTTQATPQASGSFKHDFFQTATHVTVSIFAKGVKKEATKISIQKKQLEVTIQLGEGKEYSLDLDLCGEIIPEESRSDILSTKIEIKLKKSTPGQWPSLENTGESVKEWAVVQDGPATGLTYPSSSKKHINWDKVEVEEDKLEGDAALNSVFQSIYKNADDDQRRAMLKSFQESGGTVLSTNWNEVGNGKVKGSPPAGMEMKEWKDVHH